MNNNFILIGRLTKEPILKSTSKGKSVCEITLAVNNSKNDTSFINVSLWNKTAEIVAKYCKKGDLVGTYGIITNNNYEDKNGIKHYGYTFMANQISLLSSNNAQKNEKTVQKSEEPEEDPFSDFGMQVDIDSNFLD